MDINEYLNMVPSANMDKPKFMGLLAAVLEPVSDLAGMIENMDAYSIDYAVGNQLDYMGNILGISRQFDFLPSTGNQFMDDDEYRAILKMRMAQNGWNGTNEDARKIYDAGIFENITITFRDNGNGTVDVYIEGDDSSRIAEIISLQDSFLVPAGVGKNVNVDAQELEARTRAGVVVTGVAYKNVAMMMNDTQTYLVGDIEQMYVGDLMIMPVRRLERR